MTFFFGELEHYYRNVPFSKLDAEAVHQAKRCILDSIGCMISSADSCGAELRFVFGMRNGTECTVVGTRERANAALAGFAGSILASAQEMDDATAIGASVHPGCCVIPAALSAAEKYGGSGELLLRAVLFGYDLCNRLGLMATERIRELGLYGPGFLAAPCAAAVFGMIMGLDGKTLENAFSIAFSMAPVCPFSSFTDGADSKNLYNGWAVYLGILSAEMAQAGMTGAANLLRGKRSLQAFLSSDRGTDIPAGQGGFSSAIVFKKYSACLSVHAAMTVLERMKRQYGFAEGQIASVEIGTYPYAWELSSLAEKLTPVSARVSIPYTAAVMLSEGSLWPEAFSGEMLESVRIRELMKKIHVVRLDAFGAGPFGKRGCKAVITLVDGTVLRDETDASCWSADAPPSDEELEKKFAVLTERKLCRQTREALIREIYELDRVENIMKITALLRQTA